MIKVVLADDHPLIRGAIKLKLEGSGIEVVGEAGDGRQAVDLVESLQPDVVVLDREMPGMGGLEAARRILEDRPDERIILLTSDDDPDTIAEAAATGIRAYVLKDEPTELFLSVVRLVSEGRIGPLMQSVRDRRAAATIEP
jgi:DNA-binding NarL/FixJ family response regulator